MREFTAFKGEYVGWRRKEAERKDFLGELVRLTNERVQRLFVTTLVLSDFREVNERFQLLETYQSAYALAAASTLFATAEWVFAEREPTDGLVFFVERGDAGQGSLLKTTRARFGTIEVVQVIGKTAADGEEITPFHVPDFIACEYRSEHAYFDINKQAKAKPRGALTAIRRMLYPRVGVIDRSALQRMCAEAEIPRRR